MNGLLQDLRYALRQLLKNPGFAATAVITLALGIAVNATMFSLVSGFLLQRPPGRDPEHMIVVSSINPAQVFHADLNTVSAANFIAWRESNQVFSEMAAADEDRTVSLAGQGQAEALGATAVSANYFDVFGASALRGRLFINGEDQPGRDHVVILSEELWKRRFTSDDSVVGRTIRLNRENYTIVGVMPASFRLLGYTRQLWIPLALTSADQTAAARKDRSLHIFARLKSGVTLEQARAEMATLARRTQDEFPQVEKGWGATARTLPDFLVHDFDIRPALAVLMTVVGLVLMLACANVAGLLLSRAAGRQKELSVRLSLGATNFRIARQVLSESVVIAFLGASAGLLLSHWGIELLRSRLEVFRGVPLGLDRNVLLFSLCISVVSALLCGLGPALNASATDINASLKEEGRAASPGRSHTRLRTVLVTGEIALSLFLLIGAGLLIRGVFFIEHQDLGFQPDHLLTANVTLDSARYEGGLEQAAFVQNLLPRLQQLPGVKGVAATSSLPATGPDRIPLRIQDQPELPNNQTLTALNSIVSLDFFRTAEVPLLRGRLLTERDNRSAPRVVLVNQEFARRFFANEDAVGKQISLNVGSASPEWSEIVGIVSNVKPFSEETRDDPETYEPLLQHPLASFSLMLRTSSDPKALTSALRRTVAQIDPELPLADVMSMTTLIDRQKGGDEIFSQILSSFALLALVLAAIGIYGLIAYNAVRRTHEIGVRMALGAARLDVLRMILKEGSKLTGIGAAIGLLLAIPLPKLFAGIFYNLHASDPRLYVLVPIVIFVISIVAAYIPAHRAAKVDPMVALRYE